MGGRMADKPTAKAGNLTNLVMTAVTCAIMKVEQPMTEMR